MRQFELYPSQVLPKKRKNNQISKLWRQKQAFFTLLMVKTFPLPAGRFCSPVKKFLPSAGDRRRQEISSRHRQEVIVVRKSLLAVGRRSLSSGNHFSPSAGINNTKLIRKCGLILFMALPVKNRLWHHISQPWQGKTRRITRLPRMNDFFEVRKKNVLFACF
jgi:hypothetical protein